MHDSDASGCKSSDPGCTRFRFAAPTFAGFLALGLQIPSEKVGLGWVPCVSSHTVPSRSRPPTDSAAPGAFVHLRGPKPQASRSTMPCRHINEMATPATKKGRLMHILGILGEES